MPRRVRFPTVALLAALVFLEGALAFRAPAVAEASGAAPRPDEIGAWENKPVGPREPSRAGGWTLDGRFQLQSEAPPVPGEATPAARGAAPTPPRLVPFDVHYYGLGLAPAVGSRHVSGTAHLLIHVTAGNLTDIALDAVRLAVDAVHVNGRPRAWSQSPDSTTLVINIGSAVPGDTLRQPGDSVCVAVRYAAYPARGYWAFVRNTYTFVEPEDARYWFPCVDRPRDKARFEGWFTVPDSVYVASNGVLVNDGVCECPAPPPPPSRGGPWEPPPMGDGSCNCRWHWREDHPIATYLICVTMARYAVLHDEVDGLPLLYCVFPEDTAKARAEFARVPEMVRFFSSLLGPYPFDKYGMAAVDPARFGGMEHQSMTTINRDWVRGDGQAENGIVHELAHMWFGDSVTPMDWLDIWLNEGFATYGEALWLERTRGLAASGGAMAFSALKYFGEFRDAKFPLTSPPDEYLFGFTTYDKGAWVLHMLRRQVGDPAFFGILRRHVGDNRYGNVSSGGFRMLAEEVAGQPLAWFFDQWLDGVGYPVLEYVFAARPAGEALPVAAAAASATAAASGWDAILELRQTQEGIGAPVFRVPLEIAVQTAAGERRFTVQLSGAQDETFTFRVDAQPTGVRIDPEGWLLKRVTPHSDFAAPWPEPARVRVECAHPNPARGPIRFTVRVPHQGPTSTLYGSTTLVPVRAEAFDVRGRRLRTIADATFGPGTYTMEFDGRDGAGARLSPGVYFIRVTAPGSADSKRVLYFR